MSDENPYLKFCTTDHQRNIVKAVERIGDPTRAAKELGLDGGNTRKVWSKVKAKAAIQGIAPEEDLTHEIPEPLSLKGASTLYGSDGKVKLQWVKSNKDIEKARSILEVVADELSKDIKKAKPIKVPKKNDEDLLNVFVITDYHLGQLSWGEETRDADWDTSIAENLLIAFFQEAIRKAPSAETAIFCQLGDFLHFDGLESITPTGGNLLQTDSRFAKLVRVAIRVVREVIRMLLSKHQHVHVIMAEGNHDLASSVWLREWLSIMYADEPRITVDTSPDPYYCYEHGKTSLFFHHGHKKKPNNISDVFARKFRDVWGRTEYSYGFLGHMHHVQQKEDNLMVIEQFRTLAAADNYASRGGWMSGRDAKAITYHKDYGKTSEVTINYDFLRDYYE